ncbi:MAG TPA: GFA family protein [Rhizobiaceae bacterium]|nr:GFA family protein [Rhizobiaceae bacterium]
MTTHKGTCHCGAVQFTVSGNLRDVIYCHCTQCRKQTGHFYAATNAAMDEVAISGADSITWYAASPHALRGFCKSCGSALFWCANGSDTISILAGAFDKPTGLTGAKHIFCADKGDYYEIADGLPQFEAGG